MGERPIEITTAGRGEGEGERCMVLASLGFPIVFLTLLGHGLGIFVIRQGYWVPGPTADTAWTALVAGGLVLGLALSAWRGTSLKRN